MVDTTKILGELLGGNRGGGTLNSGSGAKILEDLLGVGSGNQGGGATGGQPAGGNNPFGGGQQTQTRGGTPAGGASSGGLGDLLGKALKELGGAQRRGTAGGNAGGSIGGSSGTNNPFEAPQQQTQSVDQNTNSEVFLRAMIQAGLADGRIDQQEQQAIINKIGNIGQAEKNFIQSEMTKGCDVNAFIQTVPRGIEEEVYAVSLMAIQLDNRTEATYLDALAKGLRITHEQSNAIHDRLGAQRLYS